jgi:superfamily II DNA/RNA helicase
VTAAIHGGRSQNQRTRALAAFAAGRVQALVATDVAARGIHVEGVGAVIHFDPPEDHKTYLHRSGRTARAGRGGVVVSLVAPEQARELGRMQRQLGLQQPITQVDMAAIGSPGRPTSRTETPRVIADPSRQHADSQPRRRQPERPAAKHQPRSGRRNGPARSRNRNRRPPARSAA